MAKQGMIQREKKRERLVAKHSTKRESIKEELKNVSSFQERVVLYKKFERIPDFETALQVRRWDDLAKDTDLVSNNISDFIGDLTLVFEAAINM